MYVADPGILKIYFQNIIKVLFLFQVALALVLRDQSEKKKF